MELTLYHSVESTCAQKVRLVLSEKGLGWTEILLNLRKGEQFAPDYLRLNPKGVVPTLVHRGQAIRESTVINEYLDHAFPQPPLKPADPLAQARMRLLVKTFDDEVHPAVGILSYALVLRHQMNALKSPQELEEHFQKIADPMRRERQRAAHEGGIRSVAAKLAVATLDRVVGDMEDALAHGPWLAGGDYSLADAATAPYLVRIEALQLAALWNERPAVRAWYKRVRERVQGSGLSNPWGSNAFHEMFTGHTMQARADIDAILSQLRAERAAK